MKLLRRPPKGSLLPRKAACRSRRKTTMGLKLVHKDGISRVFDRDTGFELKPASRISFKHTIHGGPMLRVTVFDPNPEVEIEGDSRHADAYPSSQTSSDEPPEPACGLRSAVERYRAQSILRSARVGEP